MNTAVDPGPHPWLSLCGVSNLSFRAACNAVVDPRARPVKRRVVSRLGTSREARALFKAVWEAALVRAAPLPQAFFDELISRREWATLVVETEASEQGWINLFGKEGFLGAWDRLSALWEKLFGKDAGVIPRVITIALAGGGSILPAQKLLIPIELQVAPGKIPMQVEVTAPPGTTPIPISIKGPNNETEIPVHIKGTTDDVPIKLKFQAEKSGDRPPDVALNAIVEQLTRTNVALSATSTQLTSVVNSVSGGSDAGIARRLDVLGGQVDAFRSQIDAGLAQEQQAESDLFGDLRNNLQLVAETTIRPHQQVVATLRADSIRYMVLPSFDTEGRHTSFTTVVLCTGKIATADGAGSVQLRISADAGERPCAGAKRTVHAGVVSDSPPGWQATVNAIDTPLFGHRTVTITMSPTVASL